MIFKELALGTATQTELALRLGKSQSWISLHRKLMTIGLLFY